MSAPFQSRDVREDRELADFVEFVTEVPRRITAVEVSGPPVTASLIETLRAASPIRVEELLLASPAELALQIRSFAAEPVIIAVRGLDSAADFPDEAAAIGFWQELNYHREYLAPGKVRTCFFLSPTNYRRMAVHADDLRSWARTYSFLDDTAEMMPAIVAPLAAADRTGDNLSLDVLRSQLRRAREAGLPERTIARDFALPLFSAAVDNDQVGEALHLWHEELRDGAALTEVPDDRRADALGRRSVLAQQMGDADESTRYASLALEEARHLSLPRRTWASRNALIQFSRSALLRGEFATAEAALHNALNAAQELPEGDERREYEIAVEMSLGSLHEYRGEIRKAIEYFESAREKLELLFKSTPDRRLDNLRAQAMSSLAIAYRKGGDLAAATQAAQTSLRLRHQPATDTSDLRSRHNLAISHKSLAEVYRDTGKTEEAARELSEAIDIYETLAGADPVNAEVKFELALAHGQFGAIERKNGNRDSALQSYRRAIELIRSLVETDRHNLVWANVLEQAERDAAELSEVK